MRKNCKTFMQWVESQHWEFTSLIVNTNNLHYVINQNISTYSATIFNSRTGKSRTERVKIANFPARYQYVAIGLAWASYKGEEIPEFPEKIRMGMLKSGEIFRFTPMGTEYIYIGTNPRIETYVYTNLSGPSITLFQTASRWVYVLR